MNTPIYDFVNSYARSDTARLHMPGHKGKPMLGFEMYDITEISGADVLYGAEGIISESEDNATSLFGSAHTFFCTEGSSLAIKAMLAIVCSGKSHRVLAARNAHKSFIYAAALLDLDVKWLMGRSDAHLCVCNISGADVESALCSMEELPCAVYITSPDYLGNISDIGEIARVCHRYGVPLVVDNAHGAYLRFLSPSLHPLDLGADICCDSAHKTLPVLTGGAYLHISATADASYLKSARSMLSVFASTSPSYLTLASLDRCNAYLADSYKQELAECIANINAVKSAIKTLGFDVKESEPLKIVIRPASHGYTGDKLCEYLRSTGIEAEFADNTYLVLMVTPENGIGDLERLLHALRTIEKKPPIKDEEPLFDLSSPAVAASIRDAIFAPHESLPVRECEGRICAAPTVSCPPAVPIVISGETVTRAHIRLFEAYGIDKIDVIKKDVSLT